MARRFTTGFELGKMIEHNSVTGQSGLATSGVNSSEKRTGAYGLRLLVAGNPSSAFLYMTQVLADQPDELFFRFALKIRTALAGVATFNSILAVFDDGGKCHVAVGFQSNDNVLRVRTGGTGVLGQTSGTEVAVGSAPLAANTWYVIEVRILIHGASGNVTCRINGVTDATFTGDTLTGSNAYIHLFRIGGHGIAAGQGADYDLDDIGVNDTDGDFQNSWPGQGGVYLLKPANDGNTTEWGRSAGDDNYALVDEVPADDSTFVYATDAGDKDTYTLEDLPADITHVDLVEVIVQAGLAQTGINSITPVIRHDGTDYPLTPDHPITNLAPNWIVLKSDPVYEVLGDTGAWTPSDVNALEAGMEITTP